MFEATQFTGEALGQLIKPGVAAQAQVQRIATDDLGMMADVLI
jgi:hypothetical protein